MISFWVGVSVKLLFKLKIRNTKWSKPERATAAKGGATLVFLRLPLLLLLFDLRFDHLDFLLLVVHKARQIVLLVLEVRYHIVDLLRQDFEFVPLPKSPSEQHDQ